jgi:hypothetical protein
MARGSQPIKTRGVENPTPTDAALIDDTRQDLRYEPLPHRIEPFKPSRPFSVQTRAKLYQPSGDLEMYAPDLYAAIEEKRRDENE